MRLLNILQGDYTLSRNYYQIKLPIDLEPMIPADDPVRLLSVCVEGMDLSELYATEEKRKKDLERILDKHRPTDAVFAIDAYDKRHLIKLVNMCDDRCIKVYFLPVIYGFFKTSRQIEQVGHIPVINIHSTPLDDVGKPCPRFEERGLPQQAWYAS